VSTEIQILGAYFPGWILAVLAGIVLTAVTKSVLHLLRLDRYILLPLLFYPGLILLWSGGLWILLFAS